MSVLTGRATSHRSTLSTSKGYSVQRDFTFEPKIFSELRNAQAIVLAYDGLKTTLLNALASFIDPTERVIVIEDTAEIQIQQANLVRLEARREQPDLPAVTIRDLLKATLRLRPDRILLGEVRGGEAFDLLQALNTGHSGTLSTIHANSAQLAVSRFATCVLISHVELPHKAIRASIAESLDLVIHLGRRKDKRIVTEFLRIKRYDSAQDLFEFEKLYGSE